jgi:hypothetical protein
MQEACQLLEQERRQHRELRRSLQKNNLHPASQNLTVERDLEHSRKNN